MLLYGFAAAALGGFDSILGAVVGGLIVGLAEALIPKFFSFVGSELSLVVALRDRDRAARPAAGAVRDEAGGAGMKPDRHREGLAPPPRSGRSSATPLVAGSSSGSPTELRELPDPQLRPVAADAVAILGLMIIIGYSGQVSIGQSFFFGIGAYVTAWLRVDNGWPFLLTLPVSAALGMPSASSSASRRCASAGSTSPW